MEFLDEYKNRFTIHRFRDGDTLEGYLHCTHCDHIDYVVVRLPHIESWEPKGADSARAARVAEQLTDTYRGEVGTLMSRSRRRDKYGRIIADIRIGDCSLQQLIVDANLAWFGVGRENPGTAGEVIMY
jgi:hypothetical protein